MQTLIIAGIVIVIAMYITFTVKRKRLGNAIKQLKSGEKDQVVIKQTLEQVKNIVNAYTNNVISTDHTLVFGDGHDTFIITPISDKEVILGFLPDENEVENYAKVEEEILSNDNEIVGIERMKALAGDMIDDIISTDQHTRIHESYDEFIQVFKSFPSFKEYEEAFTVVINRNKSDYKIIVMREDSSFSAYWEQATLEDKIGA